MERLVQLWSVEGYIWSALRSHSPWGIVPIRTGGSIVVKAVNYFHTSFKSNHVLFPHNDRPVTLLCSHREVSDFHLDYF